MDSSTRPGGDFLHRLEAASLAESSGWTMWQYVGALDGLVADAVLRHGTRRGGGSQLCFRRGRPGGVRREPLAVASPQSQS